MDAETTSSLSSDYAGGIGDLEQTLFRQAPIGVLIADMDGRLIDANPAFCELTGYSRAELIAMGSDTITHPDDRAADQSLADQVIEGEQASTFSVKRYRRKDGAQIWVQVTRSIVRDRSGSMRFGLAFIEDVTKRTNALESLRRSEATFAAAFNNGPIILSMTRLATGQIIEVNERFLSATGYTRAEVIGRTPLELNLWVHPEQRAAGLQQIQQHSALREGEADFRMKDGSVRTCLLFATLLDVHGDACVLTALTDITERRNAELERTRLLEENTRLFAEERLARRLAEETQRRSMFLAEASQLLTDSLDYDDKLARITRLVVPFLADYSMLYSITRDGSYRQVAVAHGDPAKELLLVKLGEQYRLDMTNPNSLVAQVIRNAAPIMVVEASRATARSITIDPGLLAIYDALSPVSYLVVPLIVAGKVTGTLFLAYADSGRHYGEEDLRLAQEVAQRAAIALDNARLYREAQEAVYARDAFFSVVSHELKTPLTTLLGQAQLLQRRLARSESVDERQQRSFQTITTQAVRLNALINELLDVARIEHGQFELLRAPLDLAALTSAVVEQMLPGVHHVIRYAAPATPLLVLGDAARLEQVIQNLLQNALKYSPGGGTVEVRLHVQGDGVHLAVQDAGIGIPAAEQARLFERFYRAASTAKTGIQGMGVGLYIVKEIVTLHGGSVTVESREGYGSTFTIILPHLTDPA